MWALDGRSRPLVVAGGYWLPYVVVGVVAWVGEWWVIVNYRGVCSCFGVPILAYFDPLHVNPGSHANFWGSSANPAPSCIQGAKRPPGPSRSVLRCSRSLPIPPRQSGITTFCLKNSAHKNPTLAKTGLHAIYLYNCLFHLPIYEACR